MNVYDQGDTIRFVAKVSKSDISSTPSVSFYVSAVGSDSIESVAAETAHTSTDWKWNVDYYVSQAALVGKWAYKFVLSGPANQVQTGEFLIRKPRL